MPRILRQVTEYYDDRIIKGLYFKVLNEGNTLRITKGSAVINENVVGTSGDFDLDASAFVVANNEQSRIDIISMDPAGTINVIHGTPGQIIAPACPALNLLLAQVSISKGWKKFIGQGANDEVLANRTQMVIDTRYVP